MLHTVETRELNKATGIVSSNLEGESKNIEQTVLHEMVQHDSSVELQPKLQSLLPTAIVQVRDHFGNFQPCRILLDSGAETSLITESCVQRLQLSRRRSNVVVKGLGPGQCETKGTTTIEVRSSYDNSKQIMLDVLILSKLPARLPRVQFEKADLCLLAGLQLADPRFNVPRSIDIIIGADRFFNILCEGQISHGNLVAQNTWFGWIVSGALNGEISNTNAIIANFAVLNLQWDTNVNDTLKNFWEMEDLPACEPKTHGELDLAKFYKSTTCRNETGRYIVIIPFKRDSQKLEESRTI